MKLTTKQLHRINDVLTALVGELGVTFVDRYASADSVPRDADDIKDDFLDDMTHRIADELTSL